MSESRSVRGGSKAVVYARCATEAAPNTEDGAAAQLARARAYATQAGLLVVAEYFDCGVSGLHKAPPAFLRMMKDVQRPDSEIGFVIVTELTRISRSLARVVRRAVALEQHGVQIVAADGAKISQSQMLLEQGSNFARSFPT
jgi:DNA invertase Pin-like site-specific DNA recombinase